MLALGTGYTAVSSPQMPRNIEHLSFDASP